MQGLVDRCTPCHGQVRAPRARAWTWGYAWILSGKIYDLNLQGEGGAWKPTGSGLSPAGVRSSTHSSTAIMLALQAKANSACLPSSLPPGTQVMEFARNVLGLQEANSTEFAAATPHPVVVFMPEIRWAWWWCSCQRPGGGASGLGHGACGPRGFVRALTAWCMPTAVLMVEQRMVLLPSLLSLVRRVPPTAHPLSRQSTHHAAPHI